MAELGHQVTTTGSAGHWMAIGGEYSFNLFVQFVAVGNDHHTGIGLEGLISE